MHIVTHNPINQKGEGRKYTRVFFTPLPLEIELLFPPLVFPPFHNVVPPRICIAPLIILVVTSGALSSHTPKSCRR